MKEFLELDHINMWTDQEEAVFFERYMMYPKRFHRIAAGIPGKTCADCVRYYYRTKKQINYKAKVGGPECVVLRKNLAFFHSPFYPSFCLHLVLWRKLLLLSWMR